MNVDVQTMMLRMCLAAALGLLIGLERESRARSAGLRTCIMVSVTGALLMSLSLHLGQLFTVAGGDSAFRLDPGRLPSYAMAGMGFLGAGAIIQGRALAWGVTTAAALWGCTAIGLSVGSGLYWPALAATALYLATLYLLAPVGKLLRQKQYVALSVDSLKRDTGQKVRELLAEYPCQVLFAGRQTCVGQEHIRFSYNLAVHSSPIWRDMLERLEQLDGVICYSWSEGQVP